jgi:hypothetical protein
MPNIPEDSHHVENVKSHILVINTKHDTEKYFI